MFYLDLFRALQNHNVRYLLVGGLAMNLHGVPRMTMDVDLALISDPENLENFLKVARELDLKPSLPVSLEELADASQRTYWIQEKHMTAFALRPPLPAQPTVDILIDVPFDINSAFNRAEPREITGIIVYLASIADMIRFKEHAGRAQDQADIYHLQRLIGLEDDGQSI